MAAPNALYGDWLTCRCNNLATREFSLHTGTCRSLRSGTRGARRVRLAAVPHAL